MDRTPLDELIGFLKHSDNYTQDTREWPDPTEPRASKPPEGKGCTCQQGEKLTCPIHGMHADPDLVELDHSWSMPQGQPIGYQQDGPRNWTQAVASLTPPQAESPEACVVDTSTQASRQGSRQSELGNDTHHHAQGQPPLFRVLGHRQRKQCGPFGTGLLDVPKFDSFVVSNRQNEPIDGFGDFRNMEKGFLPFDIPKHGARPVGQGGEDDFEGVHRSVENGSSFGVHRSSVEEPVAVHPELFGQVRPDGVKTSDDTNGPDDESNQIQSKDRSEPEPKPSQGISAREQSKSHKWSVTRLGLKLRKYRRGKYGKGMIQSEEAPEAQIWRVKGGWNGTPHHDEMQETLGIERPMIAFHIDKEGRFYFHQNDDGFAKPKDPAVLAGEVERQYPELRWGKLSVEEYEVQHKKQGATHTASMTQLAEVIAGMQTEKQPRKLVIGRDQEGRMASIQEVPIT